LTELGRQKEFGIDIRVQNVRQSKSEVPENKVKRDYELPLKNLRAQK
jgi:hypothetical protein